MTCRAPVVATMKVYVLDSLASGSRGFGDAVGGHGRRPGPGQRRRRPLLSLRGGAGAPPPPTRPWSTARPSPASRPTTPTPRPPATPAARPSPPSSPWRSGTTSTAGRCCSPSPWATRLPAAQAPRQPATVEDVAGFHGPGVNAVFGGAAGAGKALGLDVEGLVNALGVGPAPTRAGSWSSRGRAP